MSLFKLVNLTFLVMLLGACGSYKVDRAVNEEMTKAYSAYDNGDCITALQTLSKVDRMIRSFRFLQPEVSFLRGQCLERQAYYIDAVETYRFIDRTFPSSEYAYRARARIKILSAKKS